jgi:hypothetical protein
MSAAKPVDHFKGFIAKMRDDPQFGDFADDMEKAFQAVDVEADSNSHAAALFAAVEWILRQPKPVRDKLEVLRRLLDLSGLVRIPSIRAFAGW